MGLLQVKASETRIRVSVAITSTGDVTHATSLNKLKAVTQYVLPAAALEWVYIVMGVQTDSIGFNKFINEYQVSSDHVALGVAKSVFDHTTTTDETTYVLFKKGLLEAKVTSETKSFAISKRLLDSVKVTDDFQGAANTDDDETMVFSKSISVELLHAVDLATKGTGKKVTDIAHPVDVRTVSVGKRLTDNSGTTEIRTNSFTKTLADSVDAGDEFNAVALTDDGEIMVFGKRLTDDFIQSDFTSVQAEKGLQEAQFTADQIDTIDFGKGLEDVPVTSEQVGFDTGKPLFDAAVSAEVIQFGLGLGVADRAYYGDGPNFYNTYAVDYFPDDYALEGFPALSFTKSLADSVQTTDDFHGVANTDDDETMVFSKVLGDWSSTSDTKAFALGKVLTDVVAKADITIIGLGKSLADSVSKSDVVYKSSGKTLADSTTSSDTTLRNIGKGLTDSANTAEYNSFAISKRLSDVVVTTDDFLGNANADDDETMLFGKTISDSFTKSDLTIKTAGKGLADSASTGESGSIVWTDYWDIGFTDTTGGVYVGNSRTF